MARQRARPARPACTARTGVPAAPAESAPGTCAADTGARPPWRRPVGLAAPARLRARGSPRVRSTRCPEPPTPRRAWPLRDPLTMAVGSSNDFDLVVLGAGTGGYTAAFRASPAGAQGGPRRRGQARRHVPPSRLHPDQGAARVGRLRRAPPPRQGLRPQPAGRADHRLRPDGEAPRPGRDADVEGRPDAGQEVQRRPGSRAAASSTARQGPGPEAGDDGTPGADGERVLNATDIILATGSRVKSLPGLEPDGKRIVTSDDVLKMDTLPERSSSSGRARSASSSRRCTTTSARR